MMTAEQATELLRDKHGPACWCITCRPGAQHCKVCGGRAQFFRVARMDDVSVCSACHDDLRDYLLSFRDPVEPAQLQARIERWLRMVLP